MGFDKKKFLKTKFSARTEAVPVPDMKDYFPEGEEAVWTVRGLTGQEMGRANEAADRSKVAVALVEALVKGSDQERKDAAKDLLGVGSGATEDIAKRIEYLVTASIDPACSHELAVRVCEVFPIEFYQLTTAIFRLTGKGQEPGKSKPSGAMAESRIVSPSVTSGGDSSMKPDPISSPKVT